MNSRQRVEAALEHRETDRPPLDLGATAVSGAHCSIIYGLRQALGLDEPGTPVKVIEPYQMLGEVENDLRDALGIDTVNLSLPGTLFGFDLEGWKPWTTFDGTPVLVPGLFNTEPDENGDILQYPEGDTSAAPSGRMPKGGFYFDATCRQDPIDDDDLDVEDNLEEFHVLSDEDLAYLAREADRLYNETDYSIVMTVGGVSFGDVALVPAPWMKHPKGIRDVAEWYMSTALRTEYVREIFSRQCEIAVENLKLVHQAVGEKPSVVWTSSTDFGSQNAPLISPDAYRDLYMPFSKEINDLVHTNTSWKTFTHSCGSIDPLIPSFIEAGFDLLNPVQTSAVNMDASMLKDKYGERLVFWGGLVDTQKTLPFGTPEEVAREAAERIRIFGAGGGFVANPIHNIQAGVPIESLIEMYRVVRGD